MERTEEQWGTAEPPRVGTTGTLPEVADRSSQQHHVFSEWREACPVDAIANLPLTPDVCPHTLPFQGDFARLNPSRKIPQR